MNGTIITNRLGRHFVSDMPGTRRSATRHLVQSSRFARRIANLLLIGLLLSVAGMAFLPWQQTSRGAGEVVAYVPQERQQSIEAQVGGIVARLGEGLVEGSRVKKGDFILEIQPYAPNLVAQLKTQIKELENKLETENVKAQAYQQNVEGFTEALKYAVQAAEEMIEAAQDKLDAKKLMVVAFEATELQAKLNLDRQKSLFDLKIKPAREIEILQKDWDVAKAKLKSVNEDVESLKNELAAKVAEREEKRRIAQTKIDYARAMQSDALGNSATIRKEIVDLQSKLDEMSRLTITAPRDGTIFRMPVYDLGDAVKAGESILTLIPEASREAVELFVNGNDMPLIEVGQHVRLQFEGWPAVQFAGWPSVAVGTFGGTVANVDATDNGKGQFRILVTPDEQDQAWPSDRYLRQGVRANGWVMLRRVSLGYEFWRQLNGFPVIVAEEEPSKGKTSVPKLPK